MPFNVREMISGLFTNSESNSVNQPLAPQKSLLDKLGAVFNFNDTATPNKNSVEQQTALRNVSTQINLSNTDISHQLNREAVRSGVVTAPQRQPEDNSGLYLAGGYRLFPEEIYVTSQTKQSEVMRLAYSGFADKAKLSDAGAKEFVERRMAETGGKICPPNRPDVPFSDREFAAQTVTGKISIYANETDVALLKEIKNRELATLEPDAPSIGARSASTVEQITNTITDTLDATLGTDANSIGGTVNRIGVSALHVAGDAADAIGAKEAAQTLYNANSGLTKQEQVTKAAIRKSGYDVPTVARIAQETENTPEFFHDVVEGTVLGDFSEKETYGAQTGKIIGGLNPAGDVRDIAANTKNVAEDKPGSYVGLGASVVGAIPIAGDIAKPIIKTEKKVITELAEDALKTEGKQVAEKVAKEEAEKLAEEEAEKAAEQTASEATVKQTDQAAQQTVKGTASRTEPSLTASATRKPRGVAEEIPTKGDPANARAIKRQNESAELLAKEGYDIEYLPQIKGQKNPDFRIEGKTFDCYSPSKSRALNVYTDIDGKISGGQTQRIVLNLEDSAASVDELKEIIQTTPLKNLEEIFVIKNGKVARIFPFD